MKLGRVVLLLMTLAALFFAADLAASDQQGSAPQAKEGIERLRRGNASFVAGQFDTSRIAAARRIEVSAGQKPFAAILSCADSRVPPEVVFTQGLGDLFVVRVAGAVADKAVLGSVEYGVEHLGIPLVVVMGHTSCGAVKAALDSKAPAHVGPERVNIEHILAAIRPALPRARPEGDKWVTAVYASVERNVGDVIRLSPVLGEMAAGGKVVLIGAVYDLPTGKVTFSETASVPHLTPKETGSGAKPAPSAQKKGH